MDAQGFLDPWQRFDEIVRQVNELLDSFLGELRLQAGTSVGFIPESDVAETEREYILRVALPGVLEEDIDLTVERKTVIVRGERINPLEVAGGKVVRRELRDGYFERRFDLPFPVRPEQISVEYSDGMLLVRVRRPGVAER